MMKFELRNIEMFVHLGTTPEEQAKKQKVLVTFSFEYNTKKAEKSDNLSDTIDYFLIQQTIKNFPKNKTFALLEKLHHDLLASLQSHFPQIKNPLLAIEKFPFDAGSVTVMNNE